MTISVDAIAAQERQRPLHVLGPVADDDVWAMVDAEVAQAVGQPRAVAVRHPSGQDLGAGDDDSRAGAHARSSAVAGRAAGARGPAA